MINNLKIIKNKKFLLRFVLIIVLTSLIRLPYLGTIPPGNVNALWHRLPTALSGILSIILFTLIIKIKLKNNQLALMSGLMLALMPWHIEQSRIFSPVMIVSMVLLMTVLLWNFVYFKQYKFLIAICALIIIYFVYPSFWLFKLQYNLPNISNYLSNVFKLTSVEFLFYKNDSFWLGGFRTIGTMLISTLPLLLIGIYQIMPKLNKKSRPFIVIFFAILLISAANPFFPEEKEIFLIYPYLALLTGFGVIKLFEQLKSSNRINKIVIIVYLIVLSYEHVWFFHMYSIHYQNRIKNEINFKNINF